MTAKQTKTSAKQTKTSAARTNLADRETLTAIRADIAEALAAVEKKHGIRIDTNGTIRHDHEGTSAKLTIEAISAQADSGEVIDKHQAAFLRSAWCRGFKPEHLGAQFSYRGQTYEIAGWAPRASRYPLLAREVFTHGGKGRRVKFEARAVLNALGIETPEDVIDAARR